MKKSIVFLPVILSCCFFFTCDIGPKNILEKYIPPDALVVVQVRHPDTFFENMDAFLKPLGGIPLMGDVPVKDFVKSMVGAGSPVKFEWFDFTKPWGGALLPTENLFRDFMFVICIPVLNTADIKAIKEQALSAGLHMEVRDKYILLYNRKKTDSMVKPEKKIDLSRLSAFDKGALTCQVNVQHILAETGLNSKLLKNLLGAIPGLSESMPEQREMELAMGYVIKLFEVIDQTERFSTGILLNEKGISMKTFMQISDQGWVNDCFSNLTRNTGIKEYLKYIPREYLFSVVLNLNNDFLSDITERYYNFILPYPEIETDDATMLFNTMKKGINASGRRTAFAFDITINPPGPGNLPDTEIPGLEEMNLNTLLSSTFSASLLSCIELKDTEAYRNSMEEVFKSDAFKHLIDSFSGKTGFEFSIEYNKNRQNDGVMFDEIGYNIEMSKIPAYEKEKSGYEDMMKESFYLFLKEFFKKFNLYLGYKTKHCYITSGDSGIEQLRYFLEKDEYGGITLLETDVYTHFTSEIPHDAHLMGHFSIPRIISMIPGMQEIESKNGIIFYARCDNTLFESGCYWDIGEIKLLYDQLFTFIPLLLKKISQL